MNKRFQKIVAFILMFAMIATTGLGNMSYVFAKDTMETSAYTVTIDAAEHGKVVFPDSEETSMEFGEGEEVKLDIIADEGYQIESLSIMDAETGEVLDESKDAGSDSFTFEMPAVNLLIKTAFCEADGEADAEETETNKSEYKKTAVAEGEQIWNPEAAGETSMFAARGQQTITEALGIDPAHYLDLVRQYTAPGNNYYLGTPYPTSWDAAQQGGIFDFRSPNGDPWQGYARLQCTGFVWHLLRNAGGNGSSIPHLGVSSGWGGYYTGGWATWLRNNNIETYDFYSKSDMFNSGVLSYGDIVWIWDEYAGGQGSLSDYHHIGVYVGDGQTDILWSSTPDYGNAFTAIEGKAPLESYTVCKTTPPNGNMKLTKASANSAMTDGNSCYSLAGAQYGVYRNPECTNLAATLTTDGSGNTNTVELRAGNYWVKETVAPKGYMKDNKVYPVTVSSGQTATVNVSDMPLNDPAAIEIKKIDQETGDLTLQGAGTLEGAQFTIKHYGGFYTKEQIEVGKPQSDGVSVRTWVIETKEIKLSNGQITYGCSLHPNYKVSGDDFYYEHGLATLPLGTISVEESKAPEGYLLDGAWLQADGTADRIEGMYVAQIKSSNDSAQLDSGNHFSVSDKVLRGGVKIQKRDFDTGLNTPQGDASLAAPQFDLITMNENAVIVEGKTYTKGQVVKHLTADANGYVETAADLLPYGEYKIVETNVPTGYQKAGITEYTFFVNSDKTLVDMTNSIKDKVIRGGIKVQKRDTDTKQTTPQGDATLQGATFQIINMSKAPVIVEGKSYNNGQVVKTLTTDANGYVETAADLLPYGTYKLAEVGAPEGYLNQGITERTFTIRKNGAIVDMTTTEQAVINDVIRGGVKIQKRDFHSEDAIPQGGADLKGAEFDLINQSKHPVVVEGKSYKPGEVVKHLVTGENGLVQTAKDLLPYGTYKIVETKAPEGYLKEGVLERTFTIRENGTIVDMTDKDHGILNKVKRGDFEFTKRDEETQEPMADIPFRIVSNTTGESHVIYTDANGYYSSASDFIKHSENTNSDEAGSGIWFGLNEEGTNTTVIDSLGALPYDTYTLEELPCDGNEGKALYKGTVTIYQNNYKVDIGTITNSDITLNTVAKDEISGTHYASAEENVTIVDAVTYTGLKKGAGYTLKATLVDQKSGKPVENADGEPVAATKNFKAVTAEGSEEVAVTFNASKYKGKAVVVYEELYLGEEKVAEHKDILDKDQTIYFPYITTSARDYNTGTQTAKAGEEMRIVDTVYYENLQAGKTYTLEGVLVDKETGKAVRDDNGYQITAEQEFTAGKTSGEVEVVFNFDGSKLGGKTLVVYETLTKDGYELASHKDVEDEEQTIYLPYIDTYALNGDVSGDYKNVNTSDDVFVRDELHYENLQPGQAYFVSGILMDAETGKELKDSNGKVITAEQSFTPKKSSGTVEMEFLFDATGLDGKTAVVYETVYTEGIMEERAADQSIPVAEHKDLQDEDQMIYFTKISTNALDSDTDLHISKADGSVTITDTVTYENLEAGKSFSMQGVLVDKETGELIVDENGPVIAQTNFKAKKNGTVDVIFKLDAEKLAGKEVVVFETLLPDNEPRIMAAEMDMRGTLGYHVDIEDKNQTITFPDISTTALDGKTDLHISKAEKEMTVTDTVTYKGLLTGQDYTVEGQLVDVDTEEVIAESETDFSPKEADGTVAVEFTFDGSGLAGHTLVVYEDIKVHKSLFSSESVAEHKDKDDAAQRVQMPKIGTKAVDSETSDHMSKADKEVTITDTVAYENLMTGKQYTVKGTLMDVETKKAALDKDGNPLTAESTFTADKPSGTVDVAFTFDGSHYEGRTLVVYEELFLNGHSLAEHKDMEDESQRIYLPKVRTSAIDPDTELQMSKADNKMHITDTISYENLFVGQEYTVVGTLKDKKTGEAIMDDDGKQVTATAKFTPERGTIEGLFDDSKTTDGEVTLSFDFAGKNTEGKTVVVFEDIRMNDVSVASHEDLKDEAQTIHIPKVRTTALDTKTNHHLAKADEITVTDEVRYENLIPGQKYLVKGVLMDRETNAPLLDADGYEVHTDTSFIAREPDGTVGLTFAFNGENLEGHTFVAYEELLLQKFPFGTASVVEHEDITDEEQSIHVPKITTQALDSDTGVHVSKADGEITVTDTVTYKNLVPGLQYELRGQLMDRETACGALDDNHAPITANAFFVPETADGTADVTFTFSGYSLEGHTLVAYEELFYNGVSLAEHKEIQDEEQAIYIPKIRTKALDSETEDHASKADEEVTVTDTITFENLFEGQEYTVKGKLMNQETGEVMVDADGNEIVSETTFTAKAPKGTVDVVFTFNGKGMDPSTLVAYEDLYMNGVSIAEHTDLEDKDQTIYIPAVRTAITDSETTLNISKPDDKVTATDTVTLQNLIKGKQYRLEGLLVEKETGTPIGDNQGMPITGVTEFTAEHVNDTKAVTFKFDAHRLEGETVVAYEELFMMKADGSWVSVAEHRDLGDEKQSLHFPKIGTVMTDSETNDHLAYADGEITFTDVVSYENLLPGLQYELRGILMDGGKPAKDDKGDTIEANVVFTAEQPDGEAEVVFTFSGKKLEGHTLVAFEELFLNGVSVEEHKEIADEGQSVHIPKIRTQALEKDTNDHLANPDENITITDHVSYKNLIPGKEYTVSGILMDKESKKEALDDDGNTITGSTTFTPEIADGTVDVVFSFAGVKLAGKTFVAYETLTFEDVTIATHTDIRDEEQAVHMPEISTLAADSETKDHIAKADKEVAIVDTVSFENVVPERTYRLEGILMDADGEPLKDADGNDITAKAEFKPEKDKGEQDVTFTFDGSNLKGKTAVVFETLYLAGNKSVEIGHHTDIQDTKQTVHFPKIATKALDSETADHISKADENITITDTVSYENLIPGYQYELKGTLYHAETGKTALDANGSPVTAQTTFTADKESGEAVVTFTFDGSSLKGSTLVAFEELFLDGISVAEHKDKEDAEQTVYVPEIKTEALSESTNTHLALAEGKLTVIDTVSYTHLIPGKEYTLNGSLINKADERVIAENTLVFIPEAAEGNIELRLDVEDASKYIGETVVAYEELMLGEHSVAEHKDIADEAQSVHLPDIRTEAFDAKTKLNHALAEEKMVITDTVIYENLIPGETYEITGVLMDKETGKPALDDEGKEITAETSFVPKKADGETEVNFLFDGAKLSGHTLVAFETLGQGKNVYAVHADIEDEAQTVFIPKLSTSAKDKKTETNVSLAEKDTVIVDTVTYENLVPGTEYTVSGILMDKETEKPVLIEEKEVRAEKTFTPEKPDGSIEVEFHLDASALNGKDVVVFESLLLEEKEVAIHADIEDKAQTISFPGISTSAFDKADGDKKIDPESSVTIVDTVSYENLVKGQKYKVEGTLMDKASGDVLLVNGEPVKGTAEFTAEDVKGTVDVTFTFNASKLAGKELVVFEKLFQNDKEIAHHEDLNDEAQTITVNVPEPPVTEVKTGDTPILILLIAAGILLAGTGAFLFFRRKRK